MGLRVVLLLFTLLALPARAQLDNSTGPLPPSRHALWVGMGVGQGYFAPGPARLDNDVSFSIMMYATYRFEQHLITARAFGIGDLFVFPSSDAVVDAGLLYGQYLISGDLFLSASAGLALVEASRQNLVLGLPLQAQAAWRPTDLIGFSILAFSNVNPSYPFGGVTVGLQVGNLR